mmetsp:Transcript_3895/g.10097  ORF Transcript_3895/g.10097 Transcript_3895/m.10097 type:complete len:418 (-) Transcript_3895:158-1411(-)
MANPHSAIALTEGGLKLRIYSTQYAVPYEVKDWFLNLHQLRYEVLEGPILLATPAAASLFSLSTKDAATVPVAAPASPPPGTLSFSLSPYDDVLVEFAVFQNYWSRIDGIRIGGSRTESLGCCGCCAVVHNHGARRTLSMWDESGIDRFTMQRTNVPCWYTLPLLKSLLDGTIDCLSKYGDEIFLVCGETICKTTLQTGVKCATAICNCSSISEKARQMYSGNKLVGISLPVFGPLPKMGAPRVLKGHIKGTYKLAPPKFPCCFLPCVSPDLDHLVRADYFTLEEPISIEDASLVITVLANMPGLNWSHVERFPKTCSEEHCTPGGSYAFDIDMPKDDMCSDLGLEFPGVPLYTFANEALIAEYDRGVYQYHSLAEMTPRAPVPALAPCAPAPQTMDRTVEHPGGFRVVYAASFVEI